MFLTDKDYTIEDFLKSLNFIAPPGTSVAYFITPHDIGDLPAQAGFQPQLLDIPPDESQVYVQTPPVQKQDQAVTPAEYSIWEPSELNRRQPTPNLLPGITEPDELPCPFIQTLSESKTLGSDLKLLEDFYMFPKHTLFHVKYKKLIEHNKVFTSFS